MKILKKLQCIFLTKEERKYIKLYQRKYHKLSLKEKEYVLNVYRNFSDEKLKEELCNFFEIKNEEDWKDFLKEYDMENLFK